MHQAEKAKNYFYNSQSTHVLLSFIFFYVFSGCFDTLISSLRLHQSSPHLRHSKYHFPSFSSVDFLSPRTIFHCPCFLLPRSSHIFTPISPSQVECLYQAMAKISIALGERNSKAHYSNHKVKFHTIKCLIK